METPNNVPICFLTFSFLLHFNSDEETSLGF
jgi:hypothetical protein